MKEHHCYKKLAATVRCRGCVSSTMATTELFQLLNKDGLVEEDLYKWCAMYCRFRNDVRTALDVPVVLYLRKPYVIRHVYITKKDGVTIVMVTKTGAKVTVNYEKVKKRLAIPKPETFAAVHGETLEQVNILGDPMLLSDRALVLVDIQIDDSDSTGTAGIIHAPAPSYRIVGVIPQEFPVSNESDVVIVRAYIRGEHFLKEAVDIRVPIYGHDSYKSATADNPDINDAIGKAITKAYDNLDGLPGISEHTITVDKAGRISVAGVEDPFPNIALFHDSFKGKFNSEKGEKYWNAINEPILHTYASGADFSGPALDMAITNLDGAQKGADPIRKAASKMAKRLFPKGKGAVGEADGDDTTDKNTIERLKGELEEARDGEARLQKEQDELSVGLARAKAEAVRLARAGPDALAAVQRELVEVRDHADHLEKALKACNAEGEEFSRRLRGMEDLGRERDQLKRTLADFRKQIFSMSQDANALRAEIAALKKDDAAALRVELGEVRAALDRAKEDIAALREAESGETAPLQRVIEELKQDLATSRAVEVQCSQEKAVLRAENTRLEQEAVLFRRNLEDQLLKVDEQRRAIIRLEDQVSAMASQNNRLSDEFDEEVKRSRLRQLQIERLERELAEARRGVPGPEPVPRPRIPEPEPQPIPRVPEPSRPGPSKKYWPTRNARDFAEFNKLSDEIDIVGKDIVALEKRIRLNPDDNTAQVALSEQREIMAKKNKRLFELMH